MKIAKQLKGSAGKWAGVAAAAVVSGGIIAFLVYSYEVSWADIRSAVRAAPAWIFILALVLAPPVGMPLSLFLLAIGARFGVPLGTVIACVAVFLHHLLALGLGNTVSRFFSANQNQTQLWEMLEKRAGNNSEKLLFLWGLLPGLPYIVKLYLPLAMGANKKGYLIWNGAGHILGAFLFVGFGSALFEGVSMEAVILIALGVAASVGFRIYRRKTKTRTTMNRSAPKT